MADWSVVFVLKRVSKSQSEQSWNGKLLEIRIEQHHGTPSFSLQSC